MTTAQASAVQGAGYADEGSMYYNTDTDTIRVNINGTFRTLSWS
jgi:hypothetical protein